MKNLVLFALLAVALAGCSDTVYKLEVKNGSIHPVTFNFKNSPSQTLAPGATVIVEAGPYEHLEKYAPDKRVFGLEMTSGVLFWDRDAIPVKVKNNLGENAELSAGGWMDTEPKTINSGETGTTTIGDVYRKDPAFTVKADSGFPAQAVYQPVYNSTTKKTEILVTLRW